MWEKITRVGRETVNDKDELGFAGTNPLAADTDGDGLNDGDEGGNGTDQLIFKILIMAYCVELMALVPKPDAQGWTL